MTKEEFKNLKIGETFKLGNVELKVTKSDKIYGYYCKNCTLLNLDTDCEELTERGIIPECVADVREDGKDVIFIEVKNDI